MRWKRREKSPRVLADYRQVSDAVHARREARESDPAPYRTDPVEAERAVRAYAPEERIRDLGKTAQRLMNHARDIPRTHDPDWQPLPTVSDRWQRMFTMIVFVMAGIVPARVLVEEPVQPLQTLMFLAAILSATTFLLVVVSSYCRRISPWLAWTGYTVAGMQVLIILVAVLCSGAV